MDRGFIMTHDADVVRARGSFHPGRTALLVIDPVNDFLSEGGAAWETTKSTVKKNDVVAQLKRLVEGARQAGVPVLFGPMAYTEQGYADAGLHRRSGVKRLMFETKMFLAGSWAAGFHPDSLQPTRHPSTSTTRWSPTR
jgi:ureidoacrylate peracid hydrolase